MKKILTIFVVVFAVLAVGLYYGYRNLSSIARTVVEQEIPRLKFKELEVGLTSIDVRDLVYTSKTTKSKLHAQRLIIVPSLLSLLSDTFEISEIRLEQPELVIRKKASGGLDVPIPEKQEEKKKKKKEASNKQDQDKKSTTQDTLVRVGTLLLQNGRGTFIDESVGTPAAQFELKAINASIRNLGYPTSVGATSVDFQFAIVGPKPGSVKVQGSVDQAAQTADLQLVMQGLYLPLFEPYYRHPDITVKLEDGRVAVDARLRMNQGNYQLDGTVTISHLSVGPQGRLYGVDAQKLKKYLERHPEPFALKLALSGDLNEPGGMRQQLLKSLSKSIVTQVGAMSLKGARDRLKEGDVEGAKQELKKLKRELKDLFKK